jgi:hypothetical protein
MTEKPIIVFTPYPFQVGQKIRVEGGPRGGDWEVAGLTERKVRLRCPISDREVEWDRFCYSVEECDTLEWPQRD